MPSQNCRVSEPWAGEGWQTLVNVSIVLTEQRGWGDFDRSALALAPLFPA